MKKYKRQDIKEILLEQGVEKLKRFGFVNVNKGNISTDEVYSLYFIKMLIEMVGENSERDAVINELLKLKTIIEK